MKITFLGTGTSQGIPVIGCRCAVCQSLDFRDKRLRTSVHIEVAGNSFIIDSGPDFRQQVLQNRITRLDALIFTHEHKDHTAGMDDVRAFNFMQQKAIPVYARDRVIRQLEKEFSYVFAKEKYPGVPQIKVFPIRNEPFSINNITFTPIEVMHLHLPVFGYRIGNFTYITDANYIAEPEKEKIKGTKTLVVNALQHQKHVSHFNIEEALSVVEELNPEQAYFIHMGHRAGLHQDITHRLPAHVNLAYDGLQLEL